MLNEQMVIITMPRLLDGHLAGLRHSWLDHIRLGAMRGNKTNKKSSHTTYND